MAIDEISFGPGISKPIYGQFTTKEDLLLECLTLMNKKTPLCPKGFSCYKMYAYLFIIRSDCKVPSCVTTTL
jgi:hypothetical protein